MKIEYGVVVPKSDREDVNAIYKFVDNEHKTMKLTYENAKEAKNSLQVVKRLIAKEHWKMETKRMDEVLFIEKVGE